MCACVYTYLEIPCFLPAEPRAHPVGTQPEAASRSQEGALLKLTLALALFVASRLQGIDCSKATQARAFRHHSPHR